MSADTPEAVAKAIVAPLRIYWGPAGDDLSGWQVRLVDAEAQIAQAIREAACKGAKSQDNRVRTVDNSYVEWMKSRSYNP